MNSDDGRIAVGWLIVEDLVMVLALVLLPALAGPLGAPAAGNLPVGGAWATVGLTLGRVAAFVALMLVVGARVFPWILKRVEATGSRELFTLAVIALSLGDPPSNCAARMQRSKNRASSSSGATSFRGCPDRMAHARDPGASESVR